jgi:heterotetrameric sarcosine oxidase delta subunit
MRICCPWCGWRDQTEFVWGDDAAIVRPAEPERATDAEWTDYLYFRPSARGALRERWQHVHGCGAWFAAERDTTTHRWLPDG